MNETGAANERALSAAESTEALDRFLSEEQQHILKLTGKILNRNITVSDDEYSIALMAVSEAVKNYDGTRGSFWSYAAYVIKSRELDNYRKNARVGENEIAVMPELFEGETEESETDRSLQHDINEKTAVTADTALRDEIETLRDELKDVRRWG